MASSALGTERVFPAELRVAWVLRKGALGGLLALSHDHPPPKVSSRVLTSGFVSLMFPT